MEMKSELLFITQTKIAYPNLPSLKDDDGSLREAISKYLNSAFPRGWQARVSFIKIFSTLHTYTLHI